jgi:hypothetical protein
MKYILSILFLIIAISEVNSKPKQGRVGVHQVNVLVIGGTAPGIGAAIQSARKGLQTMLLVRGNYLGDDLDKLDSASGIGLAGEYLKSLASGDSRGEVLNKLTKPYKNLKIAYDLKIITMNNTSAGWDVKLDDSSSIQAQVIVEIDKALYADYKEPTGMLDVAMRHDLYGDMTRTAIGVSTRYIVMGNFPLKRFVDPAKKNFVMLVPGWGEGDFLIGQVAGAIANSCVKHKTTGMDVREVQTEMMAVGSSFLDFHNHEKEHPHYKMFQRVLLTGILNLIYMSNGTFFSPDKFVDVQQIREGFTAYYPKSHLWFQNHTAGNLSISDVLALFRFTTNQGEALNLRIASDWQGKLGLKTTFNIDRDITREEFAVLVDTYLDPFKVRVDIDGKIIVQ